MGQPTVLVVGNGGREHALCLALQASKHDVGIHCIPGNAGTALIGTNHAQHGSSIEEIVSLAESLNCDLVVVGPEAPLCDGLADLCMARGIPCFGPVAALAHLEGSKLHAKQMMERAGVPTAHYLRLDSTSDLEAALNQMEGAPFVIKRDVLAGGKGVVVTEDRAEALDFLSSSITTDGFVLLESFLPGEEASMLVLMDRYSFKALPPSQDHKRAYDGDLGPNTGGMGAYCPAPVVTDAVHLKVIERIVKPMHTLLASQDIPYRGVLFIGLMIDEHQDPYVVEFNVRFGDPECQVTLPMLDGDVYELLHGVACDTLGDVHLQQKEGHALTVVLASEGYPASVKTGRTIHGLPSALTDEKYGVRWVNFAGVSGNLDEGFVSTGGRVLSCTSIAQTLLLAQTSAYSLIQSLSLEGAHYRSDIGNRGF